MTTPDLKPCPFCGKDAQIAPDEIGSGGQHVPPYHAGCFRGAGCGIAFTADDPDEAIAEWNRRALSTATPAEEDPHEVMHVYEGDGGVIIRENGNVSTFGVQSPVVASAFNAATATPADVAGLVDRLRDCADDLPSLSPPAQAVTKAMVNAAYNEGKNRGMTGMPNDFRAVLQAAGRAALDERGE